MSDKTQNISASPSCRVKSVLAAVALTTLCFVEQAAATTVLRYTTHVPATHYATELLLAPMVAEINTAEDADLQVELFPSGQLAGIDGALRAVQTGVAHMGVLQLGVYPNRFPLTGLVEVPGAFEEHPAGAHAFTQLLRDRLETEEFLPNGVRIIAATVLPQAQLVLADDIEQIESLSDLAGLKIRVPHAAGVETISALGMVPVRMPISESYLALQRGTIDGVMTPLSSAAAYDLDEVAGAATINLPLGTIAMSTVISETTYAALTARQQEVLRVAGRNSSQSAPLVLSAHEAEVQDALTASGMRLLQVPDRVLAEISDALASVQQKWVGRAGTKNPAAAQVFEDFRQLVSNTQD